MTWMRDKKSKALIRTDALLYKNTLIKAQSRSDLIESYIDEMHAILTSNHMNTNKLDTIYDLIKGQYHGG